MSDVRIEGVVEGTGWAWARVVVRCRGEVHGSGEATELRLVATDGTVVTVEASPSALTRGRREKVRGRWASLMDTELGRLARFDGGPHLTVELECTGLKGGDRLSVEGVVIERGAAEGADYRASALGPVRRLRAATLASEEPDAQALGGETAPPAASRPRLPRLPWAALARISWLVVALGHVAGALALPALGAGAALAKAAWLAFGVTIGLRTLLDALGSPHLGGVGPHPALPLPAFLPLSAGTTTYRSRVDGGLRAAVIVVFVLLGPWPSALYVGGMLWAGASGNEAPASAFLPLAAALYFALSLVLALRTTLRVRAAWRMAGALLDAPPWTGAPGWASAEGVVVEADEPLSMRARVRRVLGRGRSSPDTIEESVTSALPERLVVRTDRGDVTIHGDRAMLATDAWKRVEGERGERTYLAQLAAPVHVLVAGTFPTLVARGPESLLLYVSAGPAPRRSLRASRWAVQLLWCGPLLGLAFAAVLLFG